MTLSTLTAILLRSGLTVPDGRPLYAYRITPAEESQLFIDWQRAWAAGQVDYAAHGAFCLLAATSFCRRYAGGPWSWDNANPRLLAQYTSQASRSSAVMQGLRYWKRPLLQNSSTREFLLSLICEGGLPPHLLSHSTHLGAYMRELLGLLERHGSWGAREHAQQITHRLPQAFCHDGVWSLCASLAEQVVAFRGLVRGAEDPLAALDARDPGWRDRLPLSLEDEVALDLIEGLLRHRVEAPEPAVLLEVDPVLDLTGAEPALGHTLTWARSVTRAMLIETLGVRADDLQGRLYLSLQLTDGRRLRAATGIPQGADRYVIQPEITQLRRAEGTIRLTVAVTGRELTTLVPVGGEALADDLPWVFRASDGMLVGVGGGTTRAAAVWVALPEGWRVADTAPTESKAWGDRTLHRLEANATLEGPGGQRHAVRVQQEEEAARYLVRGPTLASSLDHEVYVGLPRVWKILSGQIVQAVPAHQLRWHTAGGPQRPPSGPGQAAACVGHGTLSVWEGTSEVYRTRLRVVPASFALQTRAAPNQHGGVLRVSGQGVRSLGVPANESMSVERVDACQVRLQATGTAPASVDVEVLLEGQGSPTVTFRTAFPESSARLVRRDGGALTNDSLVAIYRLGTVAARATGALARERLILTGQLQAPDRRHSRARVLGRLRQRTEDVAELSLDEVGETLVQMLASSTSLDARVALTLERELGGQQVFGRAVVCRYEGSLEPWRRGVQAARPSGETGVDVPPASPSGPTEVEAVTLAPAARTALGDAAIARLVLEARPLDQPQEAPIQLTADETGERWLVPDTMTPGPWMLTARQENLIRLRPLCINVRLADASPPSSPLRSACRLPHRIERAQALDAVLTVMGQDLGHPDWPLLRAFVEATAAVPAASYEAVVALTRHPQTAALLLLTSAKHALPVAFRALEQLPHLWSLLPQQTWVDALGQVVAWAERSVPLELRTVVVKSMVASFVDDIIHLSRPLSVLAEVLGALLGLPAPAHAQLLPAAFSQHFLALREGFEETLRRNIQTDWPVLPWLEPLPASTHQQLLPVLPRLKAELTGPRADGLLAPFFAAQRVVACLSFTPDQLEGLRQARTFDREWFDVAMTTLLIFTQPPSAHSR